MLKIILSGCCGRMGRSIAQQVNADEDVRIVAGVDVAGDAYDCFPVYRSVFDVTEPADVIVDFSHHSSVGSLIEFAVSHSYPVVLSTTGHTQQEQELVDNASKKIAVFQSANMSLGVNVLLSLCKKAAAVLHDNFDIEIVEMHHNQKLDAPSGTALLLANGINQMLPVAAEYEYNRQPKREKRPKNQIGIHSLRGGTVVGEHSVIFAGHNETLTLSHSASSREVFACGALRAAKYLRGKEHGKYSMDDLIQATLS